MPETPTPPRRRWRRLLVLIAVLAVGMLLARHWLGGPSVAPGSYVLLELQGAYSDQPPDALVGRLFREQPVALIDLLMMLRDVREDDRIAGIVVRLRPLQMGWAKAQEIRGALLALRDAGKPVVAYLEQEFAPSTLEYYIASAAQTIYLPPGATAPVTGLLSQFLFLGGVWDKLAIDMQVEKIREYKTFGDMVANTEMSRHQREMENALLDSIYEQFIDGIAAARGLEPAAVRATVDAGPATAAELQAHGLADGEKFLDELRRELVGDEGKFLAAEDYAGGDLIHASPEHQVAVVYGVGAVTTGKTEDGAFDAAGNMGADTIVDAFREAAENDDVAAIVFRVDSPGGSALASDLIWRAVQQARLRKPVIVSMSDVAASGGYYVAAGATRIVASPGTFTGSIGVVLMKPNLSGLLAKLGINTDSLQRGALADMMSVMKSMSGPERARIVQSMERVYGLFVDRVAAGRGLAHAAVDAVGRGRVWTGAQAQTHGLVDELGGFFTAVNAAKTAIGVPVDERVGLIFYPKHKPLVERLVRLLGTRVIGSLPPWLRELRTALRAYEFPPGSVLTLMPQQIVIR